MGRTAGIAKRVGISLIAAAMVLAAMLGAAGPAAASVNAPTWSTGDFWTWSWTLSGVTFTTTWTVLERATVPIGTRSYDAWHVNETDLRTTASGSSTSWNDVWVRDADLAMAKEVLGGGAQTLTWDPPLPGAVFPLGLNSWSGVTTQTRTALGSTSSVTITYSGTALPDTDLSTPKGTFHVTPVRSPSAGSSYTMSNYSDAVGNWVEIQIFQNGALTTTELLTDYRYQAPGFALFLWVVGGLVGLGIAGVAVLLVLRRRHGPVVHYPASPRNPPQPPPPGGPPGNP